MLEPRRIESNIVPQVFENLGNGNWYYNYDIKSREVELPFVEEDNKTEIRYDYILIKMVGKPDYKRCVEAIIREYLTLSLEFDLINSYNKALLNPTDEESMKSRKKYSDYLDKLLEIKSKIKLDFSDDN